MVGLGYPDGKKFTVGLCPLDFQRTLDLGDDHPDLDAVPSTTDGPCCACLPGDCWSQNEQNAFPNSSPDGKNGARMDYCTSVAISGTVNDQITSSCMLD